MTKNQKIIAALSIVSVLVIGAGVLTYTLRDNNSDSSMDKNETEQVIQETSNSSILSGVEELVSQEDQTTDIETGDEVELKETISNETEDNETVDQEQDSVEKVEYETYTNEFFPNFELVYPSDYSLQELYDPINEDSPFALTINLNKFQNSETLEQFSLVFNPRVGPIDCLGPVPDTYEKSFTFDSGLIEYISEKDDVKTVNYGNPRCANFSIKSNLDVNSFDIISSIENKVIYDVDMYGSSVNTQLPLSDFRSVVKKNNYDTKRILIDE